MKPPGGPEGRRPKPLGEVSRNVIIKVSGIPAWRWDIRVGVA